MPASSNNVRAFFTEAQDIADELEASGHPVTTTDQNMLISRGFTKNETWHDRMLALQSFA